MYCETYTMKANVLTYNEIDYYLSKLILFLIHFLINLSEQFCKSKQNEKNGL